MLRWYYYIVKLYEFCARDLYFISSLFNQSTDKNNVSTFQITLSLRNVSTLYQHYHGTTLCVLYNCKRCSKVR